MKRAAIYIRVSTDEQAKHGLSLGEQKVDLEAYARRKGYMVVGLYADEGISARRGLKRRHELQHLLADVRNGSIDIILIKCLDRWFRNVADFYEVQKILDAHHVFWECSQEDYNTTTTNGRLMLNLKLSIAQNESDQTSDRIKYVHEGMKRNRLEVCNRHPFGYELKDRRLHIVEKERPIVEFMFQQILAGYSTHSIAARIYDRFRLEITNKRVWNSLRNRTYIGERYGIPGFCPAIIDEDTFRQVQEILSFNRQPKRTGRIYLFTGKVICPGCGRRMVGHHVKPPKNSGRASAKIYYCSNYNNGKPSSTGNCCGYRGGIRENVIERFLLQHIDKLLHDYQVEWIRRQNEPAHAEAQARTLRAKISRLKDLYVNGLIEADEFRQKYDHLDEQLKKIESTAARRQDMPRAMQRILQSGDFLSLYLDLTDEKKRELWQSIIERIDIVSRPRIPGSPYKDLRITFYS